MPGRIANQKWTNAAGSTLKDQFRYAYDRAGNRTYRDIPTTLTNNHDYRYTYDGLNRLVKANKGTLVSGAITDANALVNHHWHSLDALGNWAGFRWDADGGADSWTTQSRTHNHANEITAISGTGANWVDPTHDPAGNMTLAPRPGDEADANDALLMVYDAWNRPAEVYDDDDADGTADPGELIATYRYDGQNRRITRTIEGDPDVTYHDFYNAAWQLLEVRKGSDTDPLKQFVWDVRYVDALLLRWYDADTDGSAVTHYAMHDAQFNITGLIAGDGSVVERYEYDAYGQRTVLDADFSEDADNISDFGFQFGHQGLMHDRETGLIHNRNRMRHPTLGRFIQRDPLGYVVGMNTYAGYHLMRGELDSSGLQPRRKRPPRKHPEYHGYCTPRWRSCLKRCADRYSGAGDTSSYNRCKVHCGRRYSMCRTGWSDWKVVRHIENLQNNPTKRKWNPDGTGFETNEQGKCYSVRYERVTVTWSWTYDVYLKEYRYKVVETIGIGEQVMVGVLSFVPGGQVYGVTVTLASLAMTAADAYVPDSAIVDERNILMHKGKEGSKSEVGQGDEARKIVAGSWKKVADCPCDEYFQKEGSGG